jgi:hypothetical protein
MSPDILWSPKDTIAAHKLADICSVFEYIGIPEFPETAKFVGAFWHELRRQTFFLILPFNCEHVPW